MWGRDDSFAKPTRGETAAAAANARFEVLDGGHWAIFEHPDQTAQAIEAHWAAAG
ncbi:MAG: hypothetical protein WD598_17415 [Acidimicrobiia bacterium]